VHSVYWIFIAEVPAWQWLADHVIMDKTSYNPHNIPLTQVSKREADEHPFPIRRAVAVFCVTTTEPLALDLSAHSLPSSFLEWIVNIFSQTDTECNNMCFHIEVKILRWQTFRLLLIDLQHFPDSKKQFFTLQNSLYWC